MSASFDHVACLNRYFCLMPRKQDLKNYACIPSTYLFKAHVEEHSGEFSTKSADEVFDDAHHAFMRDLHALIEEDLARITTKVKPAHIPLDPQYRPPGVTEDQCRQYAKLLYSVIRTRAVDKSPLEFALAHAPAGQARAFRDRLKEFYVEVVPVQHAQKVFDQAAGITDVVLFAACEKSLLADGKREWYAKSVPAERIIAIYSTEVRAVQHITKEVNSKIRVEKFNNLLSQ